MAGWGLAWRAGWQRAGADIAIAARDESKSQAAVAELSALTSRCRFYALHVSSANSCRETVERVVEDFGRCDILINNAGMNIRKLPSSLRNMSGAKSSTPISAARCSVRKPFIRT